MAHICVGKLTIIGSDNGLAPKRRQTIIWTSAGILLIGPLGTTFSEMLIEIQTFPLNKMHLKMSSAKWRPFCLGLNVLITYSKLNFQYYWCRSRTYKDTTLAIVVRHCGWSAIVLCINILFLVQTLHCYIAANAFTSFIGLQNRAYLIYVLSFGDMFVYNKHKNLSIQNYVSIYIYVYLLQLYCSIFDDNS